MSTNVFQRLGPRASSSFRQPYQAAAKNQDQKQICRFYEQGYCKYGAQCRNLHPSSSPCFESVANLEGHLNAVTGIAVTFDKMYTGSTDKSVKAWDNSGQCIGTLNVDGEIGCMISAGPWVFVGMPNLVKAWNFEAKCELNLDGPVGQVYALAIVGEFLCAGVQDGSIYAWKFDPQTNTFLATAILAGHSSAVVSIAAGQNNMLYSGSADNTIKVWNLENAQGIMECVETVTGHTKAVTSVMPVVFSGHNFLISCSLDKTMKVWLAGADGKRFELHHTQNVRHPALTLCGMNDLEGKPVLLCSCNDDRVRVYDLPTFTERGKIYAKKEVRIVQVGAGGTFFTGDGAGLVQVWKWSSSPADK